MVTIFKVTVHCMNWEYKLYLFICVCVLLWVHLKVALNQYPVKEFAAAITVKLEVAINAIQAAVVILAI